MTGHAHQHSQESQSHGDSEGEQSHEYGHIERVDLIRIAVTALIATVIWFRVWEPLPRISLLGVAGVLVGGYPIFREASRTSASAA